MYTEEYFWRKGSRRALAFTAKANSLLKTFWRVLSFQIYRDSYKLVKQAVTVYGKSTHVFKSPESIDSRVNAIAQRISDSENVICWGVDCVHVARYLDKDFSRYMSESSESYKILWRLAYAVKNSDHELIYEELNEALDHIESHEKAYDDRKEVARPGDVARGAVNGIGEAGGVQ